MFVQHELVGDGVIGAVAPRHRGRMSFLAAAIAEQLASPSFKICAFVLPAANAGCSRRNWLTHVDAPSSIPAPGLAHPAVLVG